MTAPARTPAWVPDKAPSVADDAAIHIVCECSPDWSCCGLDMSAHGFVSADQTVDCELCLIAWEEEACPRCGG